MPIYHKQGIIPPKRHTQFRKSDGNLYYEELFGTIGFDGMSSLLYHTHRPTQIIDSSIDVDLSPKSALSCDLKPRLFLSDDNSFGSDYLQSRKIYFFNSHLHIGICLLKSSMQEYFYKNADCDEVLFVHYGSGRIQTPFGSIQYEYGDYIVIPRGIIYQIEVETKTKFLFVESTSPVYTPKKYRNWFGQLLEQSPYCERDYKLPNALETIDEKGEYIIKIKKNNVVHSVTYATHPFDVVGWDGYNYPYGFSIFNFEPITGRIHQPPPVHQTFETKSCVICSFVPRLYDYHPLSIPAPYNHSNIDSDELIYYVDGDFMSRNDIKKGNMTLHPGGVPHGPAPGAYERSIGKTYTEELAVMIDTFHPLNITAEGLAADDGKYFKSWIDGN